jgi:hypothetical protein
MNIRSKMRLVPLLVLGMAIATAASGNAQDRQYQRSRGTDASLQITFGTTPHWVGIPGTGIREIRQGDRTDYDMFKYGRSYYAYNNANDRWYMSRGWRGQFMLIDDRSVPRELRRIPRNHWRNYPTAWANRNYRGNYQSSNYQGSGGTSASLQVTFGSTPHWAGVSGTRVEMVPAAERPNYDVFRYGGTYYVYNSNRWYTSSRESGQFTAIDDGSVPSELSKVPRENWRNYPPAWGTQKNKDNRGRGNNHGH